MDAYIAEDGYNEVGSRKSSHRLGYQESSTGGRIELDGRLEVDEWKELLESVPGVNRVILHTKGSKEQQGNTGNHYQKHNFLVFSSAYPSLGWEFELSRHPHSKDPQLRFTVTALFKPVGNRAKQLEAWRILCASVTGRELLPQYSKDHTTFLRQKAREESFPSAQGTAVPAEPKTKHVKYQHPQCPPSWMIVDIDASSEEGDPGPEPTQIAGNIPDEEWPPFLTDEAIAKESETEAQMMDFKLRCFDNTETRWRAEGPPQEDGYAGELKAHYKNLLDSLRSKIDGIGASLQEHLLERSPGQKLTVSGKQFLEDMSASSLKLITWKVDVKNKTQCLEFLKTKEKFLEQLPTQAVLHSGKPIITPEEKLEAVIGMIKKHTGEVIAVRGNSGSQKWDLLPTNEFLTNSTRLPNQFQLHRDGKTYDERNEKPPINSRQDDHSLKSAAMRIAGRGKDCDYKVLMPDFGKQRYRVICPCINNPKYIWVRSGNACSLGELFDKLSSHATAAQIYYSYLHQDILAVKRWKGKNKSDDCAPHIGMRWAQTSATALKRKFMWKHEIVFDYCKLNNPNAAVPEEGSRHWHAMLSEALRHVHARMLQDISPPFLTEAFGAQTSDSLSAYTRATFLFWNVVKITQVFGKKIASDFQERVGAHDLELAGILGRPLYQCGAVKTHSGSGVNPTSSDREAKLEDFYCINVASMSHLLQFRDEQKQWQCTSCAERNNGASSSRRVLHLYPLVFTDGKKMTPMRSPAFFVALHAPSRKFDWSQTGGTLKEDSIADPSVYKKFASFNAPESSKIWRTSEMFTP